MNIVNESNLGKVKSVFNDNESNAHYYKIINKAFKDRMKSFEFAKPIIQVNKGTIVWQSFSDGPFINYSSLNREEKKTIDTIIQRAFSEMEIVLKDMNDKEFLNNIIEIPDESSIFITNDRNNNSKIILTEWGYTKDEYVKSEGVLKKILSTSMKSFILKFKSYNNQPLEGINVRIVSEDLNYEGSSNMNGFIKLNNLKKGDTLDIRSVDDDFKGLHLKITDIEEHSIIVERNHLLTFTVVDSMDAPVINRYFTFSSALYKGKKFKTDSDGNFRVSHREIDGTIQIYSPENETLFVDKMPTNDQTYTILYNPPIEDIQINTNEDLLNDADDNIELEFLNWRRKPISNQEINIYGSNGKTSYTTNKDGIVGLETLNKGIEYAIFMNFKGSNWKRDFTHTDKEKYTFIVKRKRFLWLWLPFMIFFLLLLLIPLEIEHHYTVLDKNTKQPINAVAISTSNKEIYKTMNHNYTTDSLGKVSIPYGKSPLYKQIFNKPSTEVNAHKYGYDKLQASISLAYFKTQKSIIYLDKWTTVPSNENVDFSTCDSEGDAHKAGGNSIKEFDLKQDSGSFTFMYYTGEVHADLINIYNCSKSEKSKKNLIWSINEASIIKKYVPINFSSRIITVEVIGGGNIKSVWSYYVECPIH